MCGIAAIAGIKINKHYNTKAMLDSLKHRGPDAEGELVLNNCWLGHRRLSIVDLESGEQPMVDGELAITFNGEIYNYSKLRTQLEVSGHHFKTRSDAEVILKAYRMWGHECPKYLDGMFAFIIWDNKRNEMFIVRDRLGKKPLYYFFDSNAILCASEIKSLLVSGGFKRELDYSSIDNYLRLMYIPPWKSVYKNIHQIPPAHFGIFKNGAFSLKRYWEVIYEPIDISYKEAKIEIHRLLRDAIRKRISFSDVEIGALLSGGLDSSIVTLIAATELDYPLKVFSVNYSGHDEVVFAKQVSSKIGGNHFIQNIDECLTQELEMIISYFDEPHADTSDFPQHLLSDLASQKVKVVLSGDGADELFFGYKWHLQYKDVESNDIFYRRLNSICAFSYTQRLQLWQSSNIMNDDICIQNVYSDMHNKINNVAMFDITSHLPGQILTKIDRAGMMHGLEIRSPFLDTALVEFVFNLPYEYKIYRGEQKYILKDIVAEYMPRDFVYRQKQGFGAPIDKWLHNSFMRDYVYTKLGAKAKIRSIFIGKNIDACLHDFYFNNQKDERSAQRIWVLLCLENWMATLD